MRWLSFLLFVGCGSSAVPVETGGDEPAESVPESSRAGETESGPCEGATLTWTRIVEQCQVASDRAFQLDTDSVSFALAESGPFTGGRRQRLRLVLTNTSDAPLHIVSDPGPVSARVPRENEEAMAIGGVIGSPMIAFVLSAGGTVEMDALVDLSEHTETCMGSSCVPTRGGSLAPGNHEVVFQTPFRRGFSATIEIAAP
ncbi:MAG: hypothetical protein AAGE52_13185 [Myxococcota bacterium]